LMFNFEAEGEPVAQGRPRFTTIGGHARAYDPPKSREYKKLVREVAELAAPDEPLDGPFKVEITVFKPLLKSFTKQQTREALSGELRPTKKPDTDNYAKGILDAIKKLFWNDDGQVVMLVAEKYYSDVPRIEVSIEEVKTDGSE